MAKATTKSAKASTKEAKVESKEVEVEVKEMKSKAQVNFEKSVESIKQNRSTGNPTLDALGSKVLYGIFNKELTFKESEEDLYEGTLGKASISITKVPHGTKNTRIILNVAGIEIQGEFAARAFKMAHASLNKKGRKSIQVDEAQVNDVMALLG